MIKRDRGSSSSIDKFCFSGMIQIVITGHTRHGRYYSFFLYHLLMTLAINKSMRDTQMTLYDFFIGTLKTSRQGTRALASMPACSDAIAKS